MRFVTGPQHNPALSPQPKTDGIHHTQNAQPTRENHEIPIMIQKPIKQKHILVNIPTHKCTHTHLDVKVYNL